MLNRELPGNKPKPPDDDQTDAATPASERVRAMKSCFLASKFEEASLLAFEELSTSPDEVSQTTNQIYAMSNCPTKIPTSTALRLW